METTPYHDSTSYLIQMDKNTTSAHFVLQSHWIWLKGDTQTLYGSLTGIFAHVDLLLKDVTETFAWIQQVQTAVNELHTEPQHVLTV